jgi:tetratricopeptide (TPR) repeat protein
MQIGFSDAEAAKAREDIGVDDAVRLAQEDVFALIESHRTLDRLTRVRYGTNVRRFFHFDLQSMDRVCDCRPKAPALSRRSLDLPDDGTSARCHAAKPPHLAGGSVFTVQSVATLQRHEECREARMRGEWRRSRKTVGRGFVAGRDAERRDHHHTRAMTPLTNIDITRLVERATATLAGEKDHGSAPRTSLLLLGDALARDYRTAPADQPTTRTFYTKENLRLALPTFSASAAKESFHATPDQLGRWLATRRHTDLHDGDPVEVRLIGPTAPQRRDHGHPRQLYLHVVVSAGDARSVLYDSRSVAATFIPATPPSRDRPQTTISEIPAPLPDFVGREAEFKEINAGLVPTAEQAPTYVLHGPPGSGKTELAIRIAHALTDTFSIRLLIDARGLDPAPPDSLALLRLIARRIGGMPEADAVSPLDLITHLARTIGERHVLIVLDNVHSSNQIVDVRVPPGSAILITAREPIAYPGAHLREIDALDRGAARMLIAAATPAASAALPAKWRQRPFAGAERVIADGSATIADVLAWLCAYAPIALRAAANLLRLGDFAPVELAERLRDEQHRLDRLGDVGIRTPIAAMLAVSYKRLSAGAADTLHHVAVFPAEFDLPAARAIGADAASIDELLARGFIQRRSKDRLLLHDLYRLYARMSARADDPDAFELSRVAHAAYFINMADHVAALWREGETNAQLALAAMEAEWANFEAAYAWAAAYADETGDTTALDDLVLDLRWLLIHLRDAATLLAWSERAHDLAIAQARPANASRHLVSIAIAHYLRGDTAAEWEAQTAGLALATEVGDEALMRVHAANVAVSLEYAGRLEEALAEFESVVALDRAHRKWRDELSDQISLALIAQQLCDFRKAETAAKRAAEIAREHGQQQELGNALGILGNIHAEEEEWPHALDYYSRALDAFIHTQYHAGEVVVRANIGRIHVVQGEKHGLVEISDALDAARATYDRRGELHALFVLGRAHEHLRDWSSAIAAYTDALPLAETLRDRPREGLLRYRRARSYTATRNLTAARVDLNRATSLITWEPFASRIARRLYDL